MNLEELQQNQQFQKGKMDGMCGYENNNIGHAAPCPLYHVGYVCGICQRLLEERNIKEKDWSSWELVAELEDIRYPLSSPATYKLVPKNAIAQSE